MAKVEIRQHPIQFYQDFVAGLIHRYDQMEAEATPGKPIPRPMLTAYERGIFESLFHDLQRIEASTYQAVLKRLSQDTKRSVPPKR